jgi:hypothetical protein
MHSIRISPAGSSIGREIITRLDAHFPGWRPPGSPVSAWQYVKRAFFVDSDSYAIIIGSILENRTHDVSRNRPIQPRPISIIPFDLLVMVLSTLMDIPPCHFHAMP